MSDAEYMKRSYKSLLRFLTVAWFSAREEWKRRWNLLSRLVFFGVILFVWTRIWAVGAAGLVGHPELSATSLAWYIAVTELVVLSIGYTHIGIEQDIRTGEFGNHRTRPMGYLALHLAKNYGTSLTQFTLLAIGGGLVVRFYTGVWPWKGFDLHTQMLFGTATASLAMLGLLIASTWYVTIGLMSAWLEEVSPLIWIFQKLMFLLGGLVVPVALYPAWLQSLSWFSPFGAMLGEPASLVFAPDWWTVGRTATKLMGWLLVTVLIARRVCAAAEKAVDING